MVRSKSHENGGRVTEIRTKSSALLGVRGRANNMEYGRQERKRDGNFAVPD